MLKGCGRSEHNLKVLERTQGKLIQEEPCSNPTSFLIANILHQENTAFVCPRKVNRSD